jgi:para-aminobenzoate synthetase component I
MRPVTVTPVIEELCAYRHFARLAADLTAAPDGFFLDGGAGLFAHSRYSYLGDAPFLVFASRGFEIDITQAGLTRRLRSDPFDELQQLLGQYRCDAAGGNAPFTCGAVGYFGYDMGRLLEQLPARACDDLGLPDCRLGLYPAVIIADHRRKKIMIAATGLPERQERLQQLKARDDIDRYRRRARGMVSGPPPVDSPGPGRAKSNFTRDAYVRCVEAIQRYIADGDVYQVNLSQRFACRTARNPQAVYAELRRINPAPFSCFLNCGEFAVLSASPERFVRLAGGRIQTQPIKGTRPRSSVRATDARLRRELLSSAKDRAELLMITDLERNDLGRICIPGTVAVEKLFELEAYADVYHLVATIRGEVRRGCDSIDCLRACFPGGSITGAPKIRAMEIIEELEPCRRNIYTGSIGYIGFDGGMDLNIAIRTIVHCGGRYYFHVGGGIVADSDPDQEYQETLHKGKSLMSALGMHGYDEHCLA